MFLTRSEYDRGVNTFSPEGRLFQVEYAIEAIKLGSTAIGLQTSEGVVLAVEKRAQSKLLVPSSIKKLVKLDSHMGCALSGLVADARTLVDHARVETQNHWFTYDERMGVESCVQSISDLALNFGDGEMARPYGVALLIAGVDEKGPQLWQTDPSGTYTRYDAKAIGAGSEGAQSALKDQYHKSMKLNEAMKVALEVLKQVMEEKISASNVELAVVETSTGKFRVCKKQEVQAVINELSIDPFAIPVDSTDNTELGKKRKQQEEESKQGMEKKLKEDDVVKKKKKKKKEKR